MNSATHLQQAVTPVLPLFSLLCISVRALSVTVSLCPRHTDLGPTHTTGMLDTRSVCRQDAHAYVEKHSRCSRRTDDRDIRAVQEGYVGAHGPMWMLVLDPVGVFSVQNRQT